MSRYVVRVIGPAGRETYLCRGREVEFLEHATRYPHPSNAWQAADSYSAKAKKLWPCPPHTTVMDTLDPERGSVF